MCGIAGFSFRVDKSKIFDLLYHRGPDEQGFFEDERVQLFHTRLAIQDIQGGHQPFFYKNYLIIYNGEIYNHLELRKEFLNDFAFKTTSDTETLLYLYVKYQEKMLNWLDGMFAFAIYNIDK